VRLGDDLVVDEQLLSGADVEDGFAFHGFSDSFYVLF